MKLWSYLAAATMTLGLAGCASGPTLTDLQKNGGVTSLQENAGRVFFYRESSMLGAAIRPNIKLDGNVVGDSIPGGFFFVDVVPGSHVATTTTEVERSASFAVAAGETKYIKTSPSFGVLIGRVAPELVDPVEAKRALADLSYTGQGSIPFVASATVAPVPIGPYAMTATSPPASAAGSTTDSVGFRSPTSEFGTGEQSMVPRNQPYAALPPPESIRFKTPLSEFGSGEQSMVGRVDAPPAAQAPVDQVLAAPMVQHNGPPATQQAMVQVKYQTLANNLIEHSACGIQPRAELKLLGADSEIYSAPCDNGDKWLIKCEAQNCHVMK